MGDREVEGEIALAEADPEISELESLTLECDPARRDRDRLLQRRGPQPEPLQLDRAIDPPLLGGGNREIHLQIEGDAAGSVDRVRQEPLRAVEVERGP